jgi:hypothetical protein
MGTAPRAPPSMSMTRVPVKALDSWGTALNDHRRIGKPQVAQVAHCHESWPVGPIYMEVWLVAADLVRPSEPEGFPC